MEIASLTKLLSNIDKCVKVYRDYPKPGINFKDITPIFLDPVLSQDIINYFADHLKNLQIDAIAGIETRGYFFGFTLALKLGIPFIVIRKAGKLPSKCLKQEYALEYGVAAIEMQVDAVKPGWNVLIHDDLLATGGTACAAAELINGAGGNIAGFLFLIELKKLEGTKRLTKYSSNIMVLTSEE